MPELYTEHFSVRFHDVDAWESLHTSALLRYMEQTASNMSGAAGFDRAWYADHGTAWIVRSTTLQRFVYIGYQDELTLAAWVSNYQRVRVYIDYETRRGGEPVAVGRSEWVYLDRSNQRPRAVDPQILETWFRQAPSSLWSAAVPPLDYEPLRQEQPPYILTRVVYSYEGEVLGVTNNAVYADWFDDAARRALGSWGYPLALFPPAVMKLDQQFLLIQYLGPTRPGDLVTITTTCTGKDRTNQQITILQELAGVNGERLIRAESRYQLMTSPPL